MKSSSGRREALRRRSHRALETEAPSLQKSVERKAAEDREGTALLAAGESPSRYFLGAEEPVPRGRGQTDSPMGQPPGTPNALPVPGHSAER